MPGLRLGSFHSRIPHTRDLNTHFGRVRDKAARLRHSSRDTCSAAMPIWSMSPLAYLSPDRASQNCSGYMPISDPGIPFAKPRGGV
jgi:hypothetical protein